MLAIHSLTRSLQSTVKRVFRDGTDRHTYGHRNLETELAQWANAVKIITLCYTESI